MSQPNQLNRSLGLKLVIVVVIGNIIGSGVYKKVAPMTDALHSSGWVLICWVLGGIISLFGALSNAEIAGLLANTGGEYVYYKKIYNKFFSFLFGWSLFTVIQTAAISALAFVFAESLNHVVHLPPLLDSWKDISIGGRFYPFADFNVKLTAIILIIVLTWVNSRGVIMGAGVSSAVLLLVFGSLLLIVGFGLSSGQANISQAFEMKTFDSRAITFGGIFVAMLQAFWAYQGWAAVGYVGGEIKEANKNIPRGIALGIFCIIVLYLLTNTTYLSLLTPERIEAIHNAHNEITAVEAVRSFWGTNGALFISVLIAVTTLGCTNATILTSSRVYYAMAKEGMFFTKVSKLNEKKAPSNSLLYQGVWACLLVLSGTFDQLTDMIIFAVFIYYGATALGVFILRKKMPDAPRPYKVWGYPIVPAIVVLFSATLFVVTFYTRREEALEGTVLILTGVPMWFYFKRKIRMSSG